MIIIMIPLIPFRKPTILSSLASNLSRMKQATKKFPGENSYRRNQKPNQKGY